ncbi:TPA: prepilin-type N-terminal cleavage/methylation domain-containing protein [Streptococcus agalactiae]|nr:prepilin-type N-terminal cleavage/methylation domain-containing protein [Bacillus paralicheniformis]HEO2443893.1 prepilin-type N-terminal cleavage/methylation domain-containing protein [Streptococcus agalactiae]
MLQLGVTLLECLVTLIISS